jgi:dCTP deaminase
MILCNKDIQKALDEKWIIIEPEPTPRVPLADGSECPYQTSAVDLRLGHEVSWLKAGLSLNISLRSGGLPRLLASNCVTKTLDLNEPYTLDPGKFILAKTYEKIELPIRETGPWYAARVEGRSSYARCGLLIHFTAPTIHIGFRGTITLEVMNFGSYPIALYPRTPICQLIFEQVSDMPFRNDSQFQNQGTAAGNPM